MRPFKQASEKKRFTEPWEVFIILSIVFSVGSCTFFRDDSKLAIQETSDISFIGIYGKDTVEIERMDGAWKLNSEMEPDPVALDNFFYAFENLEKVGATAGTGLDSLHSRKILIKLGKKKWIYRFYYSEGNYLLHHEGSARVYGIRIKSSPGADLGKTFSDRPSDWARRLIINISPGDLRQVRVEPGFSSGQGFIMKRDGNRFKVYSLGGIEISEETLNEEKTLLYSSYFGEIYYDEEITEDSIVERIKMNDPFYSFSIETLDNEVSRLKVYPLYQPGGDRDIYHGAITLSGQNRVLRLNYVYLDPLFQNLSYFSVK